MHYRFFNGAIHEHHYGDSVKPLEYIGDIVMAIDPSKTNCAVVFGDPGGEVISILEMTGNHWSSGKPEDTTDYCLDLIDFLRQYLSKCTVVKAGLEKAITKRGMMHHHSNMVLTEIRSAFLNFFRQEYGWHDKDVEVNNWSWKRAILPEGYRSQSEKGSARFFYQYLGDKRFLDYYEADVTDCMCIYMYLTRDTKKTYTIVCTQSEKTSRPHSVVLMPPYADSLQYRTFTYNPAFTLEENAAYFANRSTASGIAKIDISRLRVEDIYKYSLGFSEVPKDTQVRFVVSI